MTGDRSLPYGAGFIEWAEQLYELRDKDGDRIGDVIELNPQYLVVEGDIAALALRERRRYYVPVAALRGHPEDQYRVSIGKRELDRMGWGAPPAGSTWSGPEWRDTIRKAFPGYIEGSHATRLVGRQEPTPPPPTNRPAEPNLPKDVVTDDVVEGTRAIEVPARLGGVRVGGRPVGDIDVAVGPVQMAHRPSGRAPRPSDTQDVPKPVKQLPRLPGAPSDSP